MKEKMKQRKGIVIALVVMSVLVMGVVAGALIMRNSDDMTTSLISANVEQASAESDEEVEAIMQQDLDGKKVPVPEGYVGSKATGENRVDAGYVIYEGTEEVTDQNVADAKKERNQYVWVPVTDEDISKFYGTDSNGKKWGKLYTFSSSGYSNNNWTETTSGIMSITGSYREPDVLTNRDNDNYLKTYLPTLGISSSHEFLMQLEKEFNAMIESVEKYGGFYIGRYEVGNVTGSLNAEKAVEVKGNTYIYSTTWYNAYLMCKTLKGDNETVETGLIWGCQWDRTLIWLVESESKTYSEIVDSRTWGNYSNSTGDAAVSGYGSRQSTGYSEYWKANNIYDLAGNVYEWTMEARYTYYRVFRGGYYSSSGSTDPASFRYSNGTYYPTSSNNLLRLSCHTLYKVATLPWVAVHHKDLDKLKNKNI